MRSASTGDLAAQARTGQKHSGHYLANVRVAPDIPQTKSPIGHPDLVASGFVIGEAKMNLSKPLLLGLGALLVGRMLTGGSTTGQSQASQSGGAGTPSPDGGLVGGLGGLLNKLQGAGHGEIVKSWVGPGQNQPIEPKQLGSALGQSTVSDAAHQAGVSEQDLLTQLSQYLPQFVDKLTPNGRIPNPQEIAAALSQK
jgi:uncharacterized protein YidB (DUF937 family)